jgi:hypothetical protein
MISKAIPVFAAVAAASVLAHTPARAQPAGSAPVDPRPADGAANLPSDTGVQTTLPSGAVTGAGQPQGTLPQPDDGAPGGVEQRARERCTATPGGEDGAYERKPAPGASTPSRRLPRREENPR